MRRLGLLLAALACAAACSKRAAPDKYALLDTSMGAITIKLRVEKAPRTVAHFIALATGKQAWTDPRDGKVRYDPVYRHLRFHRVVPGFMIQTGDPSGDGSGETGATVEDELEPGLRFDRPGLVGLANQGPGSGDSQFFITLGPAPDLDGHHALFGEVVRGLAVAEAISKVPRDEAHEVNRPLKPVWLESVTILDGLPQEGKP